MTALLAVVPPPLVWATATLMCLSAWSTSRAIAWLDRRQRGR